MHKMGTSQDCFAFQWKHFIIYIVDLSDVDKEQDDCYVVGNEDL